MSSGPREGVEGSWVGYSYKIVGFETKQLPAAVYHPKVECFRCTFGDESADRWVSGNVSCEMKGDLYQG